MPGRHLVIWFPYLYTDLWLIREPNLPKLPLVMKKQVHGRMVVSAVDALAERCGILPGLSVADARALQPDLMVVDEPLELANSALRDLGEWCIRYSPMVGLDLPDGLIIDASGCSHLWGGEERYIHHIRDQLLAKGYSVRMAMADTIGMAWALAHHGKLQVYMVTGQSPPIFLELPVKALRIEDPVLGALHTLGLQRVRDLLALPVSALKRRFGPGLIQRIEQATGLEEEGINPVCIPEPYAVRLPCLEPIVTQTGACIALERCADELKQVLAKEQLGIRKAVFTAHGVDGKTHTIRIATNRPSLNMDHIRSLFHLQIEDWECSAGIELFLLTATHVEKYQPAQEKIWEGPAGLQHVKLAEWMDQLEARFGAGAVMRFLPSAHHLPERSVRISTSLSDHAQANWQTWSLRPMQLLDPPEKVDVTAPIPDYPPMLFRHKGRLHRIVKADGPERIEQEWWIVNGKHRDYYAVEDEEGKRYWLFRSGHYDEAKTYTWYLHGYFV